MCVPKVLAASNLTSHLTMYPNMASAKIGLTSSSSCDKELLCISTFNKDHLHIGMDQRMGPTRVALASSLLAMVQQND